MTHLHDELTELPGAGKWGGYVYVVSFSDGLVKVGRTTNPRARLTAHSKDAQRRQAWIDDYWLSSEHLQYVQNETALIRFAWEMGRAAAVGREYFTKVGFGDLVARIQAAGLRFTNPGGAVLHERAAIRLEARREAMDAAWQFRRDAERNAIVVGSLGRRFVTLAEVVAMVRSGASGAADSAGPDGPTADDFAAVVANARRHGSRRRVALPRT